ncbi:Sorbitol-6-phosphate 2-dehydrogenase [Anaerolineae bacterium]|nr:Sorbitol-6-phosphate 2-dehydrogenase [Anaerolineae bacterium]
MPTNFWNDADVAHLNDLDLLTYRSNLLGRDRSVANWGGGNTSMKTVERDFRGRETRVLWVKGSGSDLATITRKGFTALRLDDTLPLLERDTMSDDEMVSYLAHCAFTPGHPRASIETLMHAFIPAAHVDHTHADAVIAFCCAVNSETLTRQVFGDEVVWVPYIRPGFPLAKLIAQALERQPRARAVFMAKHGLVTWGKTARESYHNTLDVIQRAENYIAQRAGNRPALGGARCESLSESERRALVTQLLPLVRGAVSTKRHTILQFDDSAATLAFVNAVEAKQLALSGAACPDHLVHTKPTPLWVDWESPADLVENLRAGMEIFAESYRAYYEAETRAQNHKSEIENQKSIEMDDPFPRIILIPRVGLIATGKDAATAKISADIYQRAISVMRGAHALGGFTPLTPTEDYGVEYWPLERYKLTLTPPPRELAGRVALVTGGASGIGRAIALRLANEGAHVVIADLNREGACAVAQTIVEKFGEGRAFATQCDVTSEDQIIAAFEQTIVRYGALDILISNAGLASANPIDQTSLAEWNRIHAVLATGYFLTAREAFKVMKAQGHGGQMVFIASKNAIAPGSGAAAYSAAKASELHLARCLAEEGGALGIRVNSVCPDAVLEGSTIWNSEWRAQRAREYGIAPDQLEEHYRKRNTLKLNVYAEDVAEAVLFLVSERSAKTTGAVINVDGGVPGAYVR